MVVADVLAEEPPKMVFPKHDNVVEQLATDAADPALGDAVLPRATIPGSRGLNAEGVHRRNDLC